MCGLIALWFAVVFFFFNDTATTEIYTLSLHDALPICDLLAWRGSRHACTSEYESIGRRGRTLIIPIGVSHRATLRSEEHTSELQSRQYLVCRLLLEKKKNILIRLLTFLHTYATSRITH